MERRITTPNRFSPKKISTLKASICLLLLSLATVQAADIKLTELTLWRDDGSVIIANNELSELKGNGFMVEEAKYAELDVTNLLTRNGEMSSFVGTSIQDASNIVHLGANAFRIDNGTDLVVGRVSKANSQMFIFKTFLTLNGKLKAGEQKQLFSDVFVSRGILGTYIYAEYNEAAKEVKVTLHSQDGEVKNIAGLGFEAVDEVRIDFDDVTAAVLNVAAFSGDVKKMWTVDLNANELKAIEAATVKLNRANNSEFICSGIIEEITGMNLNKYNLKGYLADPYRLVTAGCNSRLGKRTIAIIDTTKDTTTTSSLLVFRSSADPSSLLHSATTLPYKISSFATIPNYLYESSPSPDVFLVLTLTPGPLGDSSIHYTEVYTDGPHLKIDYTAAPSTSSTVSASIKLLENIQGTISPINTPITLNLKFQNLAVSATPISTSLALEAKEYPLSDLVTLSSGGVNFMSSNETVLKILPGYTQDSDYYAGKAYYSESTISGKYLFASGASGLKLFDITNNSTLMEDVVGCAPKQLGVVKINKKDVGPFFYALCTDVGQKVVLTQSVVFVYFDGNRKLATKRVPLLQAGVTKIAVKPFMGGSSEPRFILAASVDGEKPKILTALVALDGTATVPQVTSVEVEKPIVKGIFDIVTKDNFGAILFSYRFSTKLMQVTWDYSKSVPVRAGFATIEDLPVSKEAHESSILACHQLKVDTEATCFLSGLTRYLYLLTYSVNPTDTTLIVERSSMKSVERFAGIDAIAADMDSNYLIVSGRNKDPQRRKQVYSDYYWLMFYDAKSLSLLKVITANDAPFNPTIFTGTDDIVRVYPGTNVYGSLSPYRLNAPSVVLSDTALKLTKTSPEVLLKFTDLLKKNEVTVPLSKIFTLPDPPKPTPTPEPQPEPQPKPKPSDPTQHHYIWWIIAAILLVAGILIFFICIRKQPSLVDLEDKSFQAASMAEYSRDDHSQDYVRA